MSEQPIHLIDDVMTVGAPVSGQDGNRHEIVEGS